MDKTWILSQFSMATLLGVDFLNSVGSWRRMMGLMGHGNHLGYGSGVGM